MNGEQDKEYLGEAALLLRYKQYLAENIGRTLLDLQNQQHMLAAISECYTIAHCDTIADGLKIEKLRIKA